MESIVWQELKPTEPMLFFVPRDTSAEAGWNAGFGIAELMKVNGMGVTTGDDATLVSSDANSLFNKVAARHGHADFSRIKTFAYRPFDGQLVYYDAKLLARAREKFLGKCFHAEPQRRKTSGFARA